MSRQFDVLIVGAGVAGSACAIWLARAGWRVALVEKQSFPRHKVCGECLGSSSFALLDALGVGAQVRAAAGPELRRLALMRGHKQVHAELPAAAQGTDAWGRVVGREALDTLLATQADAAGATLWQPWVLQAVSGSPGQWQCTVRSVISNAVMQLESAVLIDAHGSWESLNALRPPAPPRPSQLLAFKAHFWNADLEPGTLPVFLLDGGYGGMVLGAQGLTTLACCIRRDRLKVLRQRHPANSAGASVEAMLTQSCYGVQQALQPATRSGHWLAAGPLAPGVHLRADDSVLRVGNAAGEAHPLIGEGMTLALQSAWLLCHILARAQARPALTGEPWQAQAAREYAERWAALFRPRLRTAERFASLAMRPVLAAGLMGLLHHQPALLTRAARWGGKADRFAPFEPYRAAA
jgi:flavin-dependent dehydrogenase